MRRRPSASIVANPVLVGAVTLLVALVAVFLAYNANNGLPFVPTRELKVDIANGSNLVRGNDVREGGFRIGIVDDIKPIRLAGGGIGAQLILKLDKGHGKVPVDSQVTIRPRSALGLKYVELTRGRAKQYIADGGTLPASQTHGEVQLDDLFSTFDAKTRKASQDVLQGFGDALAARGSDLNLTLEQLPALLGHLTPVARNLADPKTQLPRFFSALDRTAATLAPVAGVQANALAHAATTFAAIAHNKQALQDTIAKSPSTLAVGTDSLRAQRPFLDHTAALSVDLNTAARELRGALPDINPALETGTPVLRRSVSLDKQLQHAMNALQDLSTAPTTNQALRGLNATVTTLHPMVRYLGPYQTVCDYWNYWWTYLADHFAEADQFGFAERALLNSNALQDDGLGTAGATHFANGKNYIAPSAVRGDIEYLHGQAYGAAVDDQGNADCENGQRGYPSGRLAGSAVDPSYYVALSAHTPGDQGPTYKGRARVPAGETFQREPSINPVAP
jgi:virulence factor Mce-like protein